MTGRATSTTSAMPASIGQVAVRNRSGGTVVTRVTMRPMNQGTALSVSATNNSTTNRATNSHFAWRAKCQKNAMSPAGGSGCSGEAVGRPQQCFEQSKHDSVASRRLAARISLVRKAVQGGGLRHFLDTKAPCFAGGFELKRNR